MTTAYRPIRVFWSTLGQRFYAARHYKIEDNRVIITGEKFDVTDDIARAILAHGITFTPLNPPVSAEHLTHGGTK